MSVQIILTVLHYNNIIWLSAQIISYHGHFQGYTDHGIMKAKTIHVTHCIYSKQPKSKNLTVPKNKDISKQLYSVIINHYYNMQLTMYGNHNYLATVDT